ncbi:MAG: hypothetical protein GC134_02710 [Proteobacteria bacterium]|nr:hypothetical protein [Pseudomonadota bacterium]
MRILHRYWYRGEDAAGRRFFVGEVAIIVQDGQVTDLMSQFPGGGLVICNATPSHWDSADMHHVCDEHLRLFLEHELRVINADRARTGAAPLASLDPIEVDAGERPYGFYHTDIGGALPEYLSGWPERLLGTRPFEVPMPTIKAGDNSL